MSQWDKILIEAAKAGDLSGMREALAGGADVNAAEGLPLIDAAQNGQKEAVALLLEQGADIAIRNDTALWMAAMGGHTDTVRFLLEKGSKIRPEALPQAAKRGHVDTVRFLAEQGADIHVNDDEALRYAARDGHTTVVQFLLEHGANPDAGEGLHFWMAAEKGHAEIIRLLVAYGADISVSDHHPLRIALQRDHAYIVAILVGAASVQDDEIYRPHREKLEEWAKWVTDMEPPVRALTLIYKDNTPMHILPSLAAAGLLGQIFEPHAWEGAENIALARSLHTRLKDVMPEHRAAIEAVDMTAFQRDTPCFVSKLEHTLPRGLGGNRR